MRGCEVIELRDADGKPMNDFTGRARREEWAPPKGTQRTLVVALDTAQYQVCAAFVLGFGEWLTHVARRLMLLAKWRRPDRTSTRA